MFQSSVFFLCDMWISARVYFSTNAPGLKTQMVRWFKQWRIQGMASMTRAMGATLTGAQKLLGKN